MPVSSKKRIGVIRGGTSSDYGDSLKSGGQIISALREHAQFETLDIFVDKSGVWHIRGVAGDPRKILRETSAAWNTLHGKGSEEVQKLLKREDIPYIGSHSTQSALALNKEFAKDIFKTKGLRTPKHAALSRSTLSDDNLLFIFRNYLHPVIVKPVEGSAEQGIILAHTFDELRSAVNELLMAFERILVEEYIRGRSVSAAVIEEARGEKLYSLIPAPYTSDISLNTKMGEAAKAAHQALGLRHYSESDLMVTPKGNIYILGTTATPKLGEDSTFAQALKHTGWHEREFAEHMLRFIK